MFRDKSKTALLFYILSAIGIVVCVLTELEKISPAIKALCGGDTGGCEQVGGSSFSHLFGISLGYWGIASYLVLLGLYRFRTAWAGLFAGVLLGAELYFVYLQIYVVNAICPLCMAQATVVVLLNLLLCITAYPPESETKYRLVFLPVVLLSLLAFYVPMKMQMQKTAANVVSITSLGDPASPYMMELFAEYQCSHCAKFDAVMKRIVGEYPELYIVFRDVIFPNNKFSPMAVAYAGSIAYYDGREAYLKTRYDIFEHQKTIGDYLKPLVDKMRQDKEMRKAVTTKLRGDQARARAVGINSTPSTVLTRDGKTVKVLHGFHTYDEMKKELDRFVGRAK